MSASFGSTKNTGIGDRKIKLIRIIPQGTIYNNQGPDRIACLRTLDSNPLIVRPLSGSPNCVWKLFCVLEKGIPNTHTNNAVHLTH